MKSLKRTVLAIVAIFSLGLTQAQDAESPFSIGADLVSNYTWRGSKADGPSIQPGVSFAAGGFEIGAWGSVSLVGGTNEADLYAAYSFDFGLSLGVTDYYYQGSEYFDYSEGGSHGFEINAGYGIGDLSLAANYMINEGAGTVGGDMYFELGYAFSYFDVFVGMGDGWHTSDTEFALCNVGIGTSKEIAITESFSLPMFAQVVVNPDSEQFNIVVGVSF